MVNIVIEEATLSEARSILEIQKKAYLSEADIYNNFQIPPLTQTLAEIESDYKHHRFYVAKIDEKIVGSINIRIESNRGFIGRLAVLPEKQKQGIASLLMKYVESQHNDLDTFELFTGHKSRTNLKFYSNRGYKPYKHQTVDENLTFVFMQKKITQVDTD